MSPTIMLTLRPSMSPQKCFTPLLLLQIVDNNVRDGEQFDRSVLVSKGWSIVGASSYKNFKGKVFYYKRVLEALDNCQIIQEINGSYGYWFVQSVSINEKDVVVGAPSRYNGVVYVFTPQDETWTEDKILTASDME